MSGPPLERLAEFSGEETEELRAWVDAGLVTVGDAHDVTPLALEQVRLVQLLRRRGFGPAAIARLEVSQPGLFARYSELLAARPGRLWRRSEAAASEGLDLEFVQRMWEAAGLADEGDVANEEDLDALRALAIALAAGISEDALIQIVRVYADAMARVAEAEARLFHFNVHQRLRADGLDEEAVAEKTGWFLDQLLPLIEPSVVYFHRKAFARAVREDLALHVAEDAGLVQPGDTSGQVPLAVAFVDLARFTTMTEAMGDEAAAQILDRFSEIVRRVVLTEGGRVVKQIGDEFMLVFAESGAAVQATAAIRSAAAQERDFLATRIGIHHGPVLCREGDYVGGTVNVAARITAQAGAHQVLVSEDVRRAAGALEGIEWILLGHRELRGLDGGVTLYEVRANVEGQQGTAIDPVCGMTVGVESSPAMSRRARPIAFCSDVCRQKFAANPDRYRDDASTRGR